LSPELKRSVIRSRPAARRGSYGRRLGARPRRPSTAASAGRTGPLEPSPRPRSADAVRGHYGGHRAPRGRGVHQPLWRLVRQQVDVVAGGDYAGAGGRRCRRCRLRRRWRSPVSPVCAPSALPTPGCLSPRACLRSTARWAPTSMAGASRASRAAGRSRPTTWSWGRLCSRPGRCRGRCDPRGKALGHHRDRRWSSLNPSRHAGTPRPMSPCGRSVGEPESPAEPLCVAEHHRRRNASREDPYSSCEKPAWGRPYRRPLESCLWRRGGNTPSMATRPASASPQAFGKWTSAAGGERQSRGESRLGRRSGSC